MNQPKSSYAADLGIAARGFLMGAADVVPGVSGGTVALVLGIYERLLESITRLDATALKLVLSRQWSQAASYVDLRFLFALATGIAVAIVSLAKLMHFLLEHHQGLTYAAFFGLILASGVLVGRMCRPKSSNETAYAVAIGLLAAGAAFFLVSQERIAAGPGLGYTFLSGAVAICAMILPGVSGSYLLLMLGKYHEITGIIKDLPKLAVSGAQLLTLVVFACGCLCGLLLFSRLLKWLLARYHAVTMAALCGFMIGSLGQVWPFQVDTTPSVAEFKDKVFEPNWTPPIDMHALTCLLIAVVAFVFVLSIDALSLRKATQETA